MRTPDTQDGASAVLDDVRHGREVFWRNPRRRPAAEVLPQLAVGRADLDAAAARFARWAPLLAAHVAELAPTGGAITSPLLRHADGWIKADHALPLAGSVKARGGFHAVLCEAERVAVAEGLCASPETPPEAIHAGRLARTLAAHTLSVGSTGNLGMSIGLLGRALGFRVQVHMSADAKPWKKAMLRARGVVVVEHGTDYADACAVARAEAAGVERTHFIDDENSIDLFLGYAVAGRELATQCREAGIRVGARGPLIVYLPCGVGGAPGGITFGLRHALGDAVVCCFVEPTEAPCMLAGLATGRHDGVSVYELGLTLRTEADGLAVPRASRVVGRLVEGLVDACCTVRDEALYAALAELHDDAELRVEPSAAAGWAACLRHGAALAELCDAGATPQPVVWTTGGRNVPDDEFATMLSQGRRARIESARAMP